MINRRQFIAAIGTAGALSALPTLPAQADNNSTKDPTKWTKRTSANGWPLLSDAKWYDVEGSDERVQLVDGDAAVLLTYVARRFQYEISELQVGEVTGFRSERWVREEFESNYLSGTAISIRPAAYPLGVDNGFFAHELRIIEDIVEELSGTVAWGGHFPVPMESHFELTLPPGHRTLDKLATRILGEDAPADYAAAPEFVSLG